MKPFYMLSTEEILKDWKTDAQEGLSAQEARRRLEKCGPNALKEREQTPAWKRFAAQFKDFMVLTLLAATAISVFLGEYADAATILVIVFFNAALGFVQEYRAEKSLDALKKLSAPLAHVLRDGASRKIEARAVVPGDILLVEAGDKICADCRVLEAQSLEAEESALTGESVPARKSAAPLLTEKRALGDHANMLYAGTIVTAGRGKAVVCRTGMDTEIGKIAQFLQQKKEEVTPLERRLDQLGKKLVTCCLAICLLVVAIGVAKGEPLFIMCMAGISLAVAAIPEGLPAIVTVALALGVQRMIRRNAIVRKLPAVETLGCVNVICSDKTGTLTQNQMTVRRVFTFGQSYDVTGSGYDIKGEFLGLRAAAGERSDAPLEACLKASVLCNNSSLRRNDVKISGHWRGKTAQWTVAGDPTEGAMIVAAAKRNVWREPLEKEYARVQEIPFDSMRAMMSVVCRTEQGYWVFAKGAPDALLAHCNRFCDASGVRALDDAARARVLAENESMADQALRVLAAAYKPLTAYREGMAAEMLEQELVFAGLVGMIDPPREEVKEAIARCKSAGIRTVMITGDHPHTAMAVAKELGIFEPGAHTALTGEEIESMPDKALSKSLDKARVFARVSPLHKLKIVRALKRAGHVVAMTGDGVNDAPAIREADIGIAMGRSGTDVAKEASAMVLTDDNFSTIVAAIEEGRSIYENIRKFIRYLLSCNTGEILTMLAASLLSLPMPLLPVQILWVNLVTDGLPAMALGVDRNAPEAVMGRPPRRKNESVFSRGLSGKIVRRGLTIGFGTLAVFAFVLFAQRDLTLARTMAFTTLVFSQLFHVFECRSEQKSALEAGLFQNPWLVAAAACSVAMQLAVLYHPLLSDVFSTVPLIWQDWAVVLLASGWNFFLQCFRSILFPRRVAQKAFSK